MWIGDDFARIFQRGQVPPDKFIQAKLFRPAYFDDAIQRRADRDLAYGTRDIVGSHRLEKHRWQMHLSPSMEMSAKSLDELEELRRADDGVGD